MINLSIRRWAILLSLPNRNHEKSHLIFSLCFAISNWTSFATDHTKLDLFIRTSSIWPWEKSKTNVHALDFFCAKFAQRNFSLPFLIVIFKKRKQHYILTVIWRNRILWQIIWFTSFFTGKSQIKQTFLHNFFKKTVRVKCYFYLNIKINK